MTQEESAALMADQAFKGRVKVCALRYADTLLIEPSNTARHNAAVAWATRTQQLPDQVAQELTPPVVMDAAVQEFGKTIADAPLQASVEATVNKRL